MDARSRAIAMPMPWLAPVTSAREVGLGEGRDMWVPFVASPR